jgi:hypothetical protein
MNVVPMLISILRLSDTAQVLSFTFLPYYTIFDHILVSACISTYRRIRAHFLIIIIIVSIDVDHIKQFCLVVAYPVSSSSHTS